MYKSNQRVICITAILITVATLLICSSCTIRTKTVLVPPTTPVILREEVKNVKIYILDEKTGQLAKAVGTLHIGQHVLTFDPSKLGLEIPK